MLPLLAQLVHESFSWPEGVRVGNEWYGRDRGGDFVAQRVGEPAERPQAVRAIILYPMNALVEDQMTRLRKALDSDAARETMRLRLRGNQIFFARYTGVTPVTGFETHPRLADDEGWQERRDKRRLELRDEMRAMASTQKAVREDGLLSARRRHAITQRARGVEQVGAQGRGLDARSVRRSGEN